MSPPALDALRALDPLAWGLDLSGPMLLETWRAALAGFVEPRDDVDLHGANVLLVGSANVYTALLPWMVLLTQAGARVRVKPARGQEVAVQAMAGAVRGTGADCVMQAWKGGIDLEAERAALAEADAVVAFGGSEALAALTRRSRAVLGFGPRFGISVLPPDPDADAVGAAVRDVALYDTRGCMSPAAVLSEGPPPMDLFATRMAEAQERWPIGAVSPMEAAGIRTRIMLTRALGGEVRQGPGWVVLYSERFDPIALPRVLCVHPTSALPAVSAHVAHLGTVAGNAPEIPALRRCALGQMQTPRHDGVHEGIDVLRWIADLR